MIAVALVFFGALCGKGDTQEVSAGSFNTSSASAYTVTCGEQLVIEIDTTDSFWQSLGGADADYYISDSEYNRTAVANSSAPYAVPANCRGTYNSTENTVSFTGVPLEECGSSITSTDSNIQYNFTLWRDHKSKHNVGAIMRYHLKKVSIVCNYNRTLESETSSPIKPNIRIGHYILDDIQTQYTMSLSFADSSYNTGSAPSSVLVDDYIYAVAEVLNADSLIKIQFQKCWAHKTATAKSDDADSYILIDAGCPKNTTTDNNGTIIVDQNNDQDKAHFKFRSFVWNDEQLVSNRNTNIYLTCTMKACRNACTDTCGYTQNYKLSGAKPPKRRRRSVDEEVAFTTSLMAGPMEIVNHH